MRPVILGGGAVVREYYLPALRTIGATAATIFDISPAAVLELRRSHPDFESHQGDFRDLDRLISPTDGHDVAIVALPNWMHEEAVSRALDRGLHVLCEKPLALTRAACERMAERAEQARRVLAVNMVRRYLPSLAALSRAVRQGLVGEVTSVDFEDGESYCWLSESGAFFRPENGGVLADMGIHYLDFIEQLVGDVTPLRYRDDSRGGVEANATFELKSSGQIPIRLQLSRTRRLRNTYVVRGTDGEIWADKEHEDACFWRATRDELTAQFRAPSPFAGGDWPATLGSSFAQLLVDFHDCISRDQSGPATPRQAARTVSLIEWAYSHRAAHEAARSSSPDRQVVTGGTGFIGSHTVARLFQEGFTNVTVPVRGYRTCASVARFPVSLPHVDLLDREQVTAALRGCRSVFHCAYGTNARDATRVTIESTRNVVEGAIAGGCEVVVVLSSAAVLGSSGRANIDESAPYAPSLGEYGLSKILVEQWCLWRARTSAPTRIVVLNPSSVYGPSGTTFCEMPLRMARQGSFAWIEDGRGMANYAYVDNVVDAMLAAARCPDAHGRRILISDGATTWRTFLSPLLGAWADRIPTFTADELAVANRSRERVGLIEMARALATQEQTLALLRRTAAFQWTKEMALTWTPDLFRRARALSNHPRRVATDGKPPPPVPPLWLADLFGPSSTTFCTAKAAQVLGWTPRVSLADGQAATVEWLTQIGLRQ
jgi:predicted dehydrogenase/nucleoside-diphosphate-sugar epimerase